MCEFSHHCPKSKECPVFGTIGFFRKTLEFFGKKVLDVSISGETEAVISTEIRWTPARNRFDEPLDRKKKGIRLHFVCHADKMPKECRIMNIDTDPTFPWSENKKKEDMETSDEYSSDVFEKIFQILRNF